MAGVTLIVNDRRIDGVQLAIFDKDGTLIDVHAYWAHMVKFRAERVCRRLGLGEDIKVGIMDSMGVVLPEMKIKPQGPVGLKKREIVLKAGVDFLVSLGYPDESKLFNEIFLEVDTYSLDHFDQIVQPLNGMVRLVRELKKNDCLIALATTDRTDRAELAMKHFDLLDDIDLIIGADMVEKPKPDREIIDLICHKLDINPQKSVMIGDSTLDIQTGVNSGCLASIAVASGMTPEEELMELTPYVTGGIGDIHVNN